MLQCTVPHYVVRVTQSVRAGFVRDLIPVGMEFSPIHTFPGMHPAYCTYGTWCIPGGKVRPGRAVDNLPPSSAVVMEENTAIPLHTSVR